MKKFDLPNSNNRQRCGKALLAASLLLVTVGGILKLPSVQAVFFPGSYHATELKLVRQVCVKIHKRLISLQGDVAVLQELASTVSSSSLKHDLPARTDPGPGWPAALHQAKKNRVSVLQKLNYINSKLNAMQGAINHQIAAGPEAVAYRYRHPAQTLAQIQQIRARCRKFDKELNELSEKIIKLAGHCE